MVKEMLKAVRKAHRLTQEDVAKILGIDRTTYTFYETGKTSPSVTTLTTLAKMYNCSVGYLAGAEENNPRFKKIESEISVKDPDPTAHLSREEQLAVMYFRCIPDERLDEAIDILRNMGK